MTTIIISIVPPLHKIILGTLSYRTMPRPPPPRPPPPLSTQSVACNNASIGGDDNNLIKLHENENGDHASTPIRHHHHHDSSNKSSNITTERIESSPLRAAANLIQSLDIAHTEMKSLAGSAAADAENARRNARTAQEIARRYQNRSYPTFKMDALEAASNTTTSSSFSITPRPKPPEMMRFDDDRDGDCFNNNNNKLSDTAEESSTTSIDDKLTTDDLPRTASKKITSSSSSSSSRNVDPSRGVFYSPTSFERIAQHHADDVLQLSLELEQTKQALKSEQCLHQNCQTSISSIQSKTANMEKRNQKLLEDSEKQRQQSTKQISDFEQELELSRLRLQAAEEDAQLALDLAKDSAEQRDEMEGYLHQAQEEIRNLKQQQQQQGHTVVNREEGSQQEQLVIVETPKRHVHFSSDTDIVQHEEKSSFEVSDTPRPPRSMITAGRQVLIRQRNMLASSSPHQDAIIRIDLTPTKSAERRQRLRQRLNEQLNESNDGTTITLFSSSSSPSRTPNSPNRSTDVLVDGTITNAATKKKLEEYHTAIRILQISGKRLDLDGYWWREHSKTMPSNNNNPIQIDIMTRQYCQNVEFKIDRQQKDINQLESLCGYLEKKLVLDEEPSC
jgi:hypothetical protein